MKVAAVILAAGKGVRMCSSLPKVAHQAAGKAMIVHIVEAVEKAGIDEIKVVVGHGREVVQSLLSSKKVEFVIQEQQLGTGHALLQAEKYIDSDSAVLVLAGDTPLLRPGTLRGLIDYHLQRKAQATVLSADLAHPSGYGRIIRQDKGAFARIVEEKDASEKEKAIQEINTGIYCFQAPGVFQLLHQTNTSNAQGEYYLTDVLEMIKNQGQRVEILKLDDAQEIYGVNDRVQLAYVEKILRKRKNQELMRQGVSIIDPSSTFIDQDVIIEADTIILPFTIIEGATRIGSDCKIGPFSRISNSSIGDGVSIESSRINEAKIGNGCNIGPYAYLRPESELHDNVKVGDFAEIKKSIIGANSKVPHLAYVGDAIIGQGVNIGAGTITCNYDGKKKHMTIIEDKAFIGSNTNLVAPVRVGQNATIGAGSTIAHDVPPDTLAVERAQQKNLKKRANKDDK
ncbi:MAG: bifunctional UDP-N-acetylglucosamine diphosphorylase/glucosamine-1-phosphate N-acetyltransferase GlmU [Syntrophomonadaceae bacterium]|jgi:bifunctional UDP-N-acetylglucosamine pyrophosphorylase/glucosamine-1-phosphate N-acetyltransferase|nr:bifunctional UDP-N-acetylglucosamine diphosphorylase/glucosamine-1-phosphate N-acetyltransferase GlmU [Syntrophomonadaceae bacterium]